MQKVRPGWKWFGQRAMIDEREGRRTQYPSRRFKSVITAETKRFRVSPLPPAPVFGLAAAPEMAIAVASVNLPAAKFLVLVQPVALLPQYKGVRAKLSPPRKRYFRVQEFT